MPHDIITLMAVTPSLLPPEALAYIGPGGGLSAIGALVALVAALTLAFIGFVWYPIRRMRRRLRTPDTKTPPAAAAPQPASDPARADK